VDRKYRRKGYQDSAPHERRGDGARSEAPKRLEGAPKGRGAERNRDEVFRCKVCGEKNDPEIAVASLCRKCGAPLHACNQCRFFDGAARWQCRQEIPAPVPAKSKANECIYYAPVVTLDLIGAKAAETPDQARAAFDRLFGKK
jgi:hypothetical protein